MAEVGTYMGASAMMMLLANPSLKLWCVDIFSQFGQEKVAAYFLREFIEQGRCVLIKDNSRRAAKIIPRWLDAVFIDDGHTTDDVLRDLNAFYDSVRREGVLFGHDFDPGNDIEKALNEFCLDNGASFDVPVPRMWRMIVE